MRIYKIIVVFILLLLICVINFKKLPTCLYNIGLDFQKKGQYAQAIQNYKRAIALNSNYTDAYYNLGFSYQALGQINPAYQNYLKVIKLDPKYADAYYQLGTMYEQSKQFNYAIYYYEKAIQAAPYELKAKRKIDELKYSGRIDSILTNKQAPQELLNLVSLDNGVQPDTLNKFYDILNLLWADNEGQRLLYIVQYNKIPIRINTGGPGNTNAQYRSQYLTKNDGNTTTSTLVKMELVINMGEDLIVRLRNLDLPVAQRVPALESVIHEICHCVGSIISPREENSLSEEMTASIIGYNIASRIINGRSLTRDEVLKHSKWDMTRLLLDNHRQLQVNNNFNTEIQSIGISLPYPDVYQNIVDIYRLVRNNPGVQKLDSLEKML